ncbi:MAG: ABC transporter ATP-binding protein [Methyloceanibacter sp.]|nr:ABC transporter ATP-binding protein [Methyloceanibacter sp.]
MAAATMQATDARVTTLLRTERLSKVYGEPPIQTTVVNKVSVEIRANALTLLMGPSGSGKTTLLMMMAGLVDVSSGQVELFGTDITGPEIVKAPAIRRHELGFIFQNYNLFLALTALENVAEVLRLKGFRAKVAYAQAKEALEAVGLGHRLNHRPAKLSGGEQQRVAIARALAGDPALIIGDEPTAALDTKTGQTITALLKEVISPKRGVLLVTHDPRLEPHADRILRIEDGRIIADEDRHG